jgi:hypothetical protein
VPDQGPSAATISVSETVALLDSPFQSVAEGVARGRYAFWLGSGISRSRVPDLWSLVRRVVEFLQAAVAAGDPGGRFRAALDEAIGLVRLTPDERARVDLSLPIAQWPESDRSRVLDALVNNYSRLLDIRVAGERQDYLLWDAIDVRASYADVSDPDVEHLCMGILLLEGAAPEITSANWDGLVEAAVMLLGGNIPQTLRVFVTSEDFREESAHGRLLKYHGCAIRAAANETAYRDYLVARLSQITDWSHDEPHQIMRDQLVTLVATRKTLVLGLSAQDANIQAVFALAKNRLTWSWSAESPAYVFSEDELGGDQKNILRVGYKDEYDEHPTEIEAGSIIRAYAKPLLLALVLTVCMAKMATYAGLVNAPNLDEADLARLKSGLKVLRDRLAGAAGSDQLAFVTRFVKAHGWVVALLRGEVPPDGLEYRPLDGVPLHQLSGHAGVTSSGVREAAAGLALLGLGESLGVWGVSYGDTRSGSTGSCRVETATGDAALFFVATGEAAVRLEAEGLMDTTAPDVVLIHSGAVPRRQQRSPRQRYGRTGHPTGRVISMGTLLEEAEDADGLLQSFREEAVL